MLGEKTIEEALTAEVVPCDDPGGHIKADRDGLGVKRSLLITFPYT